MTIKQKIKKWHVVVLIILGIGGYWVSQNIWVFEKQIPVEEYEKHLLGRWKSISREYNQDIFEEYLIDGNFYIKYIQNNKDIVVEEGTWFSKDNIINIETKDGLVLHHKIFVLTKKWLIIKHIGPVGADYSLKEKYKKI